MILSRTMRLADYDEMGFDRIRVDQTVEVMGGWDPIQHPHRNWEYALASKAFDTWFGDRNRLRVADFGCGIGLTGALMLRLQAVDFVGMYEIWMHGDEEQKAIAQMEKAQKSLAGPKMWQMIRRGLGGLTSADRDYDVAFCISTLEHIRNYQDAFRDMCRSVLAGGMLMLTTDFADSEVDRYEHAGLRAGKMFTKRTYEELAEIGNGLGFTLLGGESDWVWDESCRLVLSYGFASLVLVRNN